MLDLRYFVSITKSVKVTIELFISREHEFVIQISKYLGNVGIK